VLQTHRAALLLLRMALRCGRPRPRRTHGRDPLREQAVALADRTGNLLHGDLICRKLFLSAMALLHLPVWSMLRQVKFLCLIRPWRCNSQQNRPEVLQTFKC